MKKLNAVQIGIWVLALATGLIHLVLLNVLMMRAGYPISIPFTLNGLGYLGLLAAYFLPLPLPIIKDNPKLLRWIFMGYTAITILAWFVMGDKGDLLGIITKLIEVGLIACLWVDKRD
jgi:hypothetical protein